MSVVVDNDDRNLVVQRAAELLVSARTSGKKLEAIPNEVVPKTADEAFRVQLEVARILGQQIAGYKVSQSGGRPLAAVILSGTVFESPASLPRRAGIRVETEIAAIIGEGPIATNGASISEQGRSLVAAIAPGIELIDSRFIAQGRLQKPMERHADQLSSGGYVIGPKLTSWSHINLATRPTKMWVGDRLLIDEILSHPHPDPFGSISWLAGYLPTFGLSLTPGQFITTGSYSGAHMIIPGDEVRVEFGDIGTAVVKIGVTGHW